MLVANKVNSWFKKDLNLQIQLHKEFFWLSGFQIQYIDKYFLNQTTLDLRKEKWTFLNREFTVFLQMVVSFMNVPTQV